MFSGEFAAEKHVKNSDHTWYIDAVSHLYEFWFKIGLITLIRGWTSTTYWKRKVTSYALLNCCSQRIPDYKPYIYTVWPRCDASNVNPTLLVFWKISNKYSKQRAVLQYGSMELNHFSSKIPLYIDWIRSQQLTLICVDNNDPDGKARPQYWHVWFFWRFFLPFACCSLEFVSRISHSSPIWESSVLTSILLSTSNVEWSSLKINSVSLQNKYFHCLILPSHKTSFKLHFTVIVCLKMSKIIIHLSKSGSALFTVIFDAWFRFSSTVGFFILFGCS